MNYLEETEKAYLAGIVDTECHLGITIKHQKTRRNPIYAPTLRLTMIDPEVVWWAHELTGLGSVHLLPRKPPCHDIWLWAVTHRELEELLPEIEPYLLVKGETARLILEFMGRLGSTKVKSNEEHQTRLDMVFRIRQLNQANRLDKQQMRREYSLVAQRQSA